MAVAVTKSQLEQAVAPVSVVPSPMLEAAFRKPLALLLLAAQDIVDQEVARHKAALDVQMKESMEKLDRDISDVQQRSRELSDRERDLGERERDLGERGRQLDEREREWRMRAKQSEASEAHIAQPEATSPRAGEQEAVKSETPPPPLKRQTTPSPPPPLTPPPTPPLGERSASGLDIISLNVGGQEKCAVSRSTLCLIEGSMLAARFSGRWDEGLERDRDGNYFINFPPDVFIPLLNFLRQKEIDPMSSSSMVVVPCVPANRRVDFVRMVNYYGMPQLLSVARLVLHRGVSTKVTLNQEELQATAQEWSTLTLAPHIPWMAITCFEVEISGTGPKAPQVGWVTEKFERGLSKVLFEADIGVGDCAESWGINGQSCALLHGGRKTFLNVACWGVGDVVRCLADQRSNLLRFFINGVEAVSAQVDLPSQSLTPAVSGSDTLAFRILEAGVSASQQGT